MVEDQAYEVSIARKLPRPAVKILPDYVEKFGSPPDLRLEALKLEMAYEIGIATKLFQVPKVLAIDDKAGVLRLERIRGLRGLRRYALGQMEYLALVEQAGSALALIHRDLVLPDQYKALLPNGLRSGGVNVFLHGDYSTENVAVTSARGRNELVIIDWQASPRIGQQATYGPCFYDIAWFIGNLFRKSLFHYQRGPAVDVAADRFIEGYFKISSGSIAGLGSYLDRLLEYRLRYFEAGIPLWKRFLLAQGFSRWRSYATELKNRECHD